MPKTLLFRSQKSLTDELLESLRTPPAPDPFVALLREYEKATGVEIVTARLEEKRIRRLTRLLRKWKKGEPVEGLIITEFSYPDDLDLVS